MEGPRVYIVRGDDRKNFTQAEEFGRLFTVSDREITAQNIRTQVLHLDGQMAKFRAQDFLLLVGDPVSISLCFFFARIYSQAPVQVLKWDRQTQRYYPMTVEPQLKEVIK